MLSAAEVPKTDMPLLAADAMLHQRLMVNNPVEVDEAAVWALKFLRIGEKSVRWEVGVFASEAEQSCVTGTFTHAFVDRESGRSAPVPKGIRRAIESLPETN